MIKLEADVEMNEISPVNTALTFEDLISSRKTADKRKISEKMKGT